jgi:hypothetical protein
LSPGYRKFALTAHVTTSVGWLGAVASFLALAITGLARASVQSVRAAHLAADVITQWIIVPLSLASLISGVVQSLGTPWGLFRHYWVLIKLLLTGLATAVLFVHTRPIADLASAALEGALSDDARRIQIQLVVDASAAIGVLLVATILAVYKPRGLTRYGLRKQRALEHDRNLQKTAV